MNFLGTKMIKITVENVEGMEPHQLRRIAGLFAAIAQYAGTDNAAYKSPEEATVGTLQEGMGLNYASPKTHHDRFASDIAKDYARREEKTTVFVDPYVGGV